MWRNLSRGRVLDGKATFIPLKIYMCPPCPSHTSATKWAENCFLLPHVGALLPAQALAVHKAVEAFGTVVDEMDEAVEGSAGEHLENVFQQVRSYVCASGLNTSFFSARACTTSHEGMQPCIRALHFLTGLLRPARLSPQMVEGGEYDGNLDVVARAWRWRGLLQRAIDGANDMHGMSTKQLALYDEMEGEAHVPIPAGFQVRWLQGPDAMWQPVAGLPRWRFPADLVPDRPASRHLCLGRSLSRALEQSPGAEAWSRALEQATPPHFFPQLMASMEL